MKHVAKAEIWALEKAEGRIQSPDGRWWSPDKYTLNGKDYSSDWYHTYAAHPDPRLLYNCKAKKEWVRYGIELKGDDDYDNEDALVEKYNEVVKHLQEMETDDLLFGPLDEGRECVGNE